jgi:hypothetical protein
MVIEWDLIDPTSQFSGAVERKIVKVFRRSVIALA